MPPLFVIEFLHRVVDTFTEYFNSCTETSIKENVVIVFEVRMKGDEKLIVHVHCRLFTLTFLSNKLHVFMKVMTQEHLMYFHSLRQSIFETRLRAQLETK